ncbi:MAG TPA: protein kinase [Bryobacteraceae bacterium]|nr:protein kinase [Bryobacteraceae bacterium]
MDPDHPGPEDSRSPAVFAAGQILAGRYRIVRFLGRGGMGEVYEAEDLELREHVALKTLRPEIASDTRSIARFKQEIQLSRKISHPNVCKVFDLARHPANDSSPGAVYFLTMEMLKGETLAARLHREGAMSTEQALPLVEQAAAGLDAAHDAGIIHRDFKPGNIMLVPGPSGDRVVVTDFGLARSNAPPDTSAVTQTISGHVRGTPGYIAPELLRGGVADRSADVYALGVTVYRMVMGALPSGEPIELPNIDSKWQHAIQRALDRRPEHRFSRAGDFVAAIHGTMPAVRIPIQRAIVFSAALIGFLVVAWIGWQAWQRWRAQPPAEALQLYHAGTDDLHASAYFAATKVLAQAVRMAPNYSLAHARLAEAWVELELPENAGVEMLIARRAGTAGLSTFDRLQIDAIDLSITREFPDAAAKYQQMLKIAGTEKADLYVDLGRTYEKAEQRVKAQESYALATKADPRNAAAWLHLAALHSQALQSALAQEEFRRAEELYQVMSNLEGLTQVSYQRSVDANRRERLDENAEYARKMLETAQVTGNIHQQIRARLQLGSNATFTGDSALAEKYAQEAVETARSNHIESLAIRGILILSSAYRIKRDYASAEKYCREALALARQTQSSWLTSVSLLALAGLHDELGRSDEAAVEAREALAFFEPQRYARESLQCLTLLGRWQRKRGDPAALDSFQRTLEMAEKLQDSRQVALAHASMGSVLEKLERLPDALLHYQQSFQLATTPQQIGYAALECAGTLWMLGRYDEAGGMFDQAEKNSAKFPTLRLQIAGSRAEMLLSQRKFSQAATLSARTLSESPDPEETLELTRVLGLAQIGEGRKNGRRTLEATLAMEKSGNISAIREAQLAVAEARLENGDAAGALTLIHKIEPMVEKLPLSHWQVLALAARADPTHARPYAMAAQQQLDEIARQWGATAFQLYVARPDLEGLVRAVSRLAQTERGPKK